MNSKRVKKGDILVIGLALFSMLFGAGNVIFPPYLGMQAGGQWLGAFVAYYAVAIGLALLAMYALMKMGGTEGITGRLGGFFSAILMTAIVLCLGPMLCIPRTAATTHELAVQVLAPSVPPIVTAIVFFAIIFALCIKESAIVDIVGKFLTPAMLVGLLVLIVMGIVSPIDEIPAHPQISRVMVSAVDAGYQTMDTLGAMLFGGILLGSIAAKGYTDRASERKAFFGASVIAGTLLFAVYIGLVYLGATVSGIYDGSVTRATLVLGIVEALMGRAGVVVLGIVVSLACITTAVALTSASAKYFSKMSGGRVGYPVMLALMCVTSVAIAAMGLDTIINVASPILNIVYPPMLILVCVAVFAPELPDYISRSMVAGAVITVVLGMLDSYGIGGGALSFANDLPLSNLSMGWLLPALIFGAAAFGLSHVHAGGKHHHGHFFPVGGR